MLLVLLLFPVFYAVKELSRWVCVQTDRRGRLHVSLFSQQNLAPHAMNDRHTFQEKFERIAATRRRQKEHHKRFLAALKAKRVQEEVSDPSNKRRVLYD